MRISFPYVALLCLAVAMIICTSHMALSQSELRSTGESVSQDNDTYVKGITPARARSLVGGVLGILSIIIGWRVRTSKAGNNKTAKPWILTGMILGLTAIIFSVVHLAVTPGGFGTGGGKAGAIATLGLGVAGSTLSGRALRSRSH
jgi:Family of unknown function (DUF6223)